MTTVLKEGYTKRAWSTHITCPRCWSVVGVRVVDLYGVRDQYTRDDYYTSVYTDCPLCHHHIYVEKYPPSVVDELNIVRTKSLVSEEEPEKNEHDNIALFFCILIAVMVVVGIMGGVLL